MSALFASGHILDAIILLMVLEAGVLIARRQRQLLPNLLSGLALVVAMRLALGGAFWAVTAICLAASGVAHVVEIRRSWKRAR